MYDHAFTKRITRSGLCCLMTPGLSKDIQCRFKHILFMMKRIGRGLNATRALSWKEYLQGNSLTHSHTTT